MAIPDGAPENVHRVKMIAFKGRHVPIMLQDVNGPCPLLAIANVLLLRGQLQLPAGVGEVSQVGGCVAGCPQLLIAMLLP